MYGPPGVGKLTIGQLLSDKTGFRFFNGHKLADVVHNIFEFGTKEFVDATNYLWLYLFTKLVKSTSRGIIVSFVYGVQTLEGKEDESFVKKIVTVANKSGAKMHFIKLTCSGSELYRRVRNKSRTKHGKITSVTLLKKIRKTTKIDETIPIGKNTAIDTTSLSPKQTADRIISLLKIKSLPSS